MSAFEKAYNAVKRAMLMRESIDRLSGEVKELGGDVTALSRSHAELAQRVAAIEGYVRGRADQAAVQRRLEAPEE